MLNIKRIQKDPAEIIKLLKTKNFDAGEIIKQIINCDKKRREILQDTEKKKSELNKLSKKIGNLFREKRIDEANLAKEKTGKLKEDIKKLDKEVVETEKKLNNLLIQVPNIPHESVPFGNSEEDNEKIRSGGEFPELPGNALPHWELAGKYDIIDFELGNKITGAGFPVYKGKGAKFQRALINFFLDEGLKAGYLEIQPPIVVNEDSGYGTGQLPDKDGQMYYIQTDNLYLIPTAEVPVTNIYRDVILDVDELPVKNIAYTPCFRREAGSYGKDVRGLNRLHQFDKVEIVQIQHPGKSYETLEEMTVHIEGLIQKLELPYRIMRLCGGDISFTSALTYDFEVFAAAQKKWLEVSSVSNFESFQANRLKLRFKEKGSKKTYIAHTLNGSALALPRIFAALIENNQTPEGIVIPKILRPYTGFDIIG
jgi:seryl-tRNA synthetase